MRQWYLHNQSEIFAVEVTPNLVCPESSVLLELEPMQKAHSVAHNEDVQEPPSKAVMEM